MWKFVSCKIPFQTSGALISSDGQGWTYRIFAMAVAVLFAVTLGAPSLAWAAGIVLLLTIKGWQPMLLRVL